jgi:hypothetical protein
MKAHGIGGLAVLTLVLCSAAQALPVTQSFDTTRFADITTPEPEHGRQTQAAPEDAQPLMQLVALARSVARNEPAADELLLSADARQPVIGALSHPLRAGTTRWGHTELPGGLPPVSDRRVALLNRP